jgi:hypothetical protein
MDMVGHHHPAEVRGVEQALGILQAPAHDRGEIKNLEPGNPLLRDSGHQINAIGLGVAPFA